MKIGLIGARSVLGRVLNETFTLGGHQTSSFTREGGKGSHAFDVLVDQPPSSLVGLDAVIYLSWDTKERTKSSQRAHVEAAGRCAKHCENLGIKFLFVSTVHASRDARSLYGRYKYEAEILISNYMGKSARVGLVADDSFPLLLTSIRKLLRSYPWLSAFLDWPVYAISTKTLSQEIEKILLDWPVDVLLWFAPTKPASLSLIGCWENSSMWRFKSCMYFGNLVALIPLRGAKLDAWRGLVGMSKTIYNPLESRGMDVSDFDWKNQLDPSVPWK